MLARTVCRSSVRETLSILEIPRERGSPSFCPAWLGGSVLPCGVAELWVRHSGIFLTQNNSHLDCSSLASRFCPPWAGGRPPRISSSAFLLFPPADDVCVPPWMEGYGTALPGSHFGFYQPKASWWGSSSGFGCLSLVLSLDMCPGSSSPTWNVPHWESGLNYGVQTQRAPVSSEPSPEIQHSMTAWCKCICLDPCLGPEFLLPRASSSSSGAASGVRNFAWAWSSGQHLLLMAAVPGG